MKQFLALGIIALAFATPSVCCAQASAPQSDPIAPLPADPAIIPKGSAAFDDFAEFRRCVFAFRAGLGVLLEVS